MARRVLSNDRRARRHVPVCLRLFLYVSAASVFCSLVLSCPVSSNANLIEVPQALRKVKATYPHDAQISTSFSRAPGEARSARYEPQVLCKLLSTPTAGTLKFSDHLCVPIVWRTGGVGMLHRTYGFEEGKSSAVGWQESFFFFCRRVCELVLCMRRSLTAVCLSQPSNRPISHRALAADWDIPPPASLLSPSLPLTKRKDFLGLFGRPGIINT